MDFAKATRFFLPHAVTDPLRFAEMVRRRTIELFAAPPTGVAQTRFGPVKFEIDMSFHRLMRKYFFHTHEMFLESIFDRFLLPGTTFIDVGANCGYWSAYALSRVGPSGAVHAFEPVPQYFMFVRRLADINPGFRVVANNVACGETHERRSMTIVLPRPENFRNYDVNIGSSSLVPGFLDYAEQLTQTIDVQIVPLDAYIVEHSIELENIALIKIDAEGSEGNVLRGMTKVLSKADRKVPLLCEVLTDPTRTTPLDGRQIIRDLEEFGYQCLNCTDLKPIDSERLHFEENILCV